MKWPTVIKALLALVLLATLIQFGWFAYLWLTDAVWGLGRLLWLGVASVMAIAALVLAIVFQKRIWPHDPVVAERRALMQLVERQFKQARSRARMIKRNPDAVPWNIFVTRKTDAPSTAMAELGYVVFGDPVSRDGLTVTTWTSPTAIAYKIEIDAGAELSFNLLNLIFRRLFKNRPTLAVNAAYVEIELATVMQSSSARAGDVSTINRILNVAAYEFGVDLPVHAAIVGLEHMEDLSRAALLTGQLNDGVVFGGFLSPIAGGVEAQVGALVEEMIANLNRAQMTALQRQLLPEFCSALLNAPLQLSLLKARVQARMASLVRPLPPRLDPLSLQSIVFIGARDGMPVVDPLAQVTAQRFFSTSRDSVDAADGQTTSVTAESAGLVAGAYHSEAFLVRPNRRRTAQRKAKSLVWTLGLTAMAGGFTSLVWENHQSYLAVNRNLEAAFKTYFTNVAAISPDSDFLVQRTLMLEPLREGLARYDALDNQNYRGFLPSFSMEDMYRGLYHQELVEGYQASLIDFMEKEIFAFNSLGDGVELIQLATIEAQLHTDQLTHKQDLIDYYAAGLAEQGEVSGAFQTSLRATLDDLFSLNQPRKNRNESLRTVVAKTLSGLDTADLLYQALMRQPKYNELVDLRRLVGPRFAEVFVPLDDPQSYLVPRAYTRSGFADLFVGGEMQDLTDVLRGYRSVIGELDSATENAIARRVAQNYTGDYISRWSGFVQALELREAEGWSDAQILLGALTNASENPIRQLVSAISANTHIEVFLPAAMNEPAADSAEQPAQGAPAKARPALAPPASSTEAAAAFNIRAGFRPYLDAVKPGPDQQSQFDLFLSYAKDVNMWLSEATTAPTGTGAHLFAQFNSPEAPNPLAVLNGFVIRSDFEFIRKFGGSIVTMLDDSAMDFVRAHINGEWERQILAPHQSSLTRAFPFDPRSDTDFPLAEFADLFGAEGKLRAFEQSYLSGFKTDDGQFASRATFLANKRVDLTDEAKQALARFSEISEAMFLDGKPFLEFGLRTSFMDSGLSRLSVTSGVTLHQFSHGPRKWDLQSWPLSGVQDSRITLRVFRRARALINETYQGPWSWFRLVEDASSSLNPARGLAQATFLTDGGSVTLELDAAARFSPFAPGFFADASPPQSLFGAPKGEPRGIERETLSTVDRLLAAWRRGEPEAAEQLVTLRGRALDVVTRTGIQQRLADAGLYRAGLDGVFGPMTLDALWGWRNAVAQN